GPFSVLVPWQVAQISVYFAAIGLPRPPPRPGACAAAVAGGGTVVGGSRLAAGGCWAAIDAARSAAVPSITGIDFMAASLLLRHGASIRCAPAAAVGHGAGREGVLARHPPGDAR